MLTLISSSTNLPATEEPGITLKGKEKNGGVSYEAQAGLEGGDVQIEQEIAAMTREGIGLFNALTMKLK